MKIQPVVEGHGEVEAFPVLLRRLQNDAQARDVAIGQPIRQPRGKLVKQDELARAVELARRQPGCEAILILVDGDDDCPAELGPRMKRWAESAARGRPCEVVIAHREYEAWFLAAVESLRGQCGIRQDAPDHPAPEEPRDAKGQIRKRMTVGRSYLATADQAPLSEFFAFADAYQKSRSFRKLAAAFGALLRGMGKEPGTWPPSSWLGATDASA